MSLHVCVCVCVCVCIYVHVASFPGPIPSFSMLHARDTLKRSGSLGTMHEYVGMCCMSQLIVAIPFCEILSAEVSVSEVSRGGFRGYISGGCNPSTPPSYAHALIYITVSLVVVVVSCKPLPSLAVVRPEVLHLLVDLDKLFIFSILLFSRSLPIILFKLPITLSILPIILIILDLNFTIWPEQPLHLVLLHHDEAVIIIRTHPVVGK